MKHLLRKAAIIVSFTLIALTMVSFPRLTHSATETYTWVTATTIKSSDPNTSIFTLDDASRLSGNQYVFKAGNTTSTTPQNPILITLSISKADPLNGVITVTGAISVRNVTITDTKGVAPEPIYTIEKGFIVGKILPTSNISAVNLEALENDDVNRVFLHTDDGQDVSFGAGLDNYSNIDKVGSTYYYEPFDLSTVRSGNAASGYTYGLLAGRYRLVYEHTEGANCADGQLKNKGTNEDLSQVACTGKLYGLVNFDITYDKTKRDGSGIITMIGNDDAEQSSPVNGKPLPATAGSKDDGIDMTVDFSLTSPLDSALSGAIKNLAEFVQDSLKSVMTWISDLLNSTADYVIGKADGSTLGMLGPWTAMRNIGLTLLVMALIIIAFANVLQVDIEQYGLNRMIPKIIISIVMAFLSWLIVTFFFDFTSAMQKQSIALFGSTKGLDFVGSISINTPTAGDIGGKVGAILLLLVICIGVLVCGIVLFFTLIMRIVMLSFLVTVAPLAFILNIVPFTASLYKQWWSEFWKWMFMGPVAFIIIALGSVIASNIGGFGSATTLKATTGAVTTGGNVLIGLIIFAASMYVAATLPLKWGGNIMKGWSGLGKKAWGKTGGAALKAGGKSAWGATGIPGATKLIGNRLSTWSANREALTANKLASGVSFGRVGTSEDVLKRQQFDAAVTEAGKQIGVTSAGQPKLIARYKEAKSGYEKAAIQREMSAQGDFEKLYADQSFIDKETGGWIQPTANKETERGLWEQQNDTLKTARHEARVKAGREVMGTMGSDQLLEKTVKEKQAELIVAARNSYEGDNSSSANYSRSQYVAMMAGEKNKSLKEKRMNIMDEIAPDEVKNFISELDAQQLSNPQVSSNKARGKVDGFVDRMTEEGALNSIPDYLRNLNK